MNNTALSNLLLGSYITLSSIWIYINIGTIKKRVSQISNNNSQPIYPPNIISMSLKF